MPKITNKPQPYSSSAPSCLELSRKVRLCLPGRSVYAKLGAILFLSFFILQPSSFSLSAAKQPNILFIAVDDLNDWITPLGGHPQAKTPNIMRLAQMGLTFTQAYTAVPACEPSRVALMGGRRPWTSGIYKNGQGWKDFQAAGEGLSAQFLKAGYYVAGAGKIYHGIGDCLPAEWSDYMSTEGLFSNGPGVQKNDGYHDAIVHPDLKDDDLTDWHSVDYIIERLQNPSDKPFFLACGLFKPHLPFVAPRKYYEDFPLESIQLPTHKENDLDDIPPAGVKMAKPDGDHAKFLKADRWKAAVQSYLATVSYTDMNVGRLLDAFDASPHKDNTIIVFWTDHGWSLGEKQHWRKFALWEEPTRVPFIWVVPGVTKPGSRSERPVDLMSIYPTLCKLAGIEAPEHVEGRDISPLLKKPSAKWKYPALTTLGRGNHAVRTETHRYIRYENGDEELYHNAKDEYEWTNLASNPEYAALKEKLSKWLPTEEVMPPQSSLDKKNDKQTAKKKRKGNN